jgi:competence protein ComEC
VSRKIKLVLSWIGCVFFVISGLIYFAVSISGVIFLLLAALLCPPLMNFLKKHKKKPKPFIHVILGIILLVIGFSFLPTQPSEGEMAKQKEEKDSVVSSDKLLEMKVHFIDVGQGDAILIASDGQYMLIDAGDNNKADEVVNYLKKEGVETLAYVIGTHPHSDHIGGLDKVIQSFDVKKIIMPNKLHDTKTFEDVLDAVSDKNLKITTPKVGDEYLIGGGKFTIIAPNQDKYSNLNNYSVGIKLENENNSFVMYGDAELEAEYDILDNKINISADVLKLGHHGSDTSTSEGILKAVKPSYAIISAGLDNKYGHPHNETLQKLIDRNIQLYRTDLQGTIIATSDGENITFNAKAETIHKQKTGDLEVLEVKGIEDIEGIKVYVTKTGTKYHNEVCQYVKNGKIAIDLDKAKESYGACSRCNPPE